jgi:prolyl oligopeptidase
LIQRRVPFDPSNYAHLQVQFNSNDGTTIPMFLVGRQEVLEKEGNPTVMTAYGGFAKSMTPQFSAFVAFLMERGCLFALPNIRGGLEMGALLHEAARGRNRARAVDDFLKAAEWLIATKRTAEHKLAIFGGSNSGLIVGAALVRKPEIFRAAICIAPLLDMFRYHLFDSALLWGREFGTADDREDFLALRKYSPYHLVERAVRYPAVMLISGDTNQNCNPLHARKMTARLQDASSSGHPIILDYSTQRGHSAVLPLSTRIEALTDRLDFLCSQLQLPELNGEC